MIAFLIMAILLIASAIWTIAARRAVYSVVGLLVHFVTLAALYISLSAEFLGVVQIIVYSGAILMLFVFVIALLSSGIAPFAEGPNRMPKAAIPATAISVVALALIAWPLSHIAIPVHAAPNAAQPVPGLADTFGSVADFGKVLFTVHLLPFEITAFILMVAVIGVILLAGDQTPYISSARRAAQVRETMREAVLRAGDE